MVTVGGKRKKKEELKNYINYLLSKGRSKQQIKDELVKKGFDRYLVWGEPRGISVGGTLKSSALGFKTPEKTVKVSLNSMEVYEEVFIFA